MWKHCLRNPARQGSACVQSQHTGRPKVILCRTEIFKSRSEHEGLRTARVRQFVVSCAKNNLCRSGHRSFLRFLIGWVIRRVQARLLSRSYLSTCLRLSFSQNQTKENKNPWGSSTLHFLHCFKSYRTLILLVRVSCCHHFVDMDMWICVLHTQCLHQASASEFPVGARTPDSQSHLALHRTNFFSQNYFK